MSRKPLIVANWKMNFDVKESVSYIRKFKRLVKQRKSKISVDLKTKFSNDIKNVEIVICPSFLSLELLYNELKKTNIKLGAQDLFYEKNGAFTGEISALMIKKYCSYVILGHSERRKYFNERNELINKKIKSALGHGIKPILCIGESLKEKKQGKTKSALKKQLSECLKGINQIKKIIIAYEPVWAISGGESKHKADSPQDAENVHSFIRNELIKKYGKKAEKMKIIYGGSVNKANIKEFMVFNDVDGVLVGGASLNARSFSRIVGFSS